MGRKEGIGRYRGKEGQKEIGGDNRESRGCYRLLKI